MEKKNMVYILADTPFVNSKIVLFLSYFVSCVLSFELWKVLMTFFEELNSKLYLTGASSQWTVEIQAPPIHLLATTQSGTFAVARKA